MTTAKSDIHQEITNRIVESIETAGAFKLPWITASANLSRPVNIASGKPYNGINILSLWVATVSAGYSRNVWGTYRQWQERGCQVRKGEKSSLIVFYKTIDIATPDTEPESDDNGKRHLARASHVGNAAQIEGFADPSMSLPDAPAFDPLERAEAFARATGANIEERGDQACFIPSLDKILMPERTRFTGTETISAGESYYATLCHEPVHWTGAKPRLDRDLTGRFGDDRYAMEELVAELGAAFLCADLSITPQTREDHAQYIAHWLTVMKADKKAIFTAAAKAGEAAQYLLAGPA